MLPDLHFQNFDPLSVVIISGFYSQFTCDVEIHMNIFDNSRQYIACVPVILFIAKQAFLRFRVRWSLSNQCTVSPR
jgi:hypothetical protein